MDENDVPGEAGDAIRGPSISIVKDFGAEQQENVITGRAGSSFTLVVTNTDHVTHIDELIENTVDACLRVTNVSGTKGACGRYGCRYPNSCLADFNAVPS